MDYDKLGLEQSLIDATKSIIEEKCGAPKKEEEKFHQNLDKLVHKTFGKSKEEMKEEVEDLSEMKYGGSYKHSHILKKLRDGVWEASTDVVPGKYVELRHHTGKKIMVKVEHDPVKEEVENLDELSKNTLKSYIGKAVQSHGSNRVVANMAWDKSKDVGDLLDKLGHKSLRDSRKRSVGISKAVDKLTKEEVEDLDEVSVDLLGRYSDKANKEYNSDSPKKEKRKSGLTLAYLKAKGKARIPATYDEELNLEDTGDDLDEGLNWKKVNRTLRSIIPGRGKKVASWRKDMYKDMSADSKVGSEVQTNMGDHRSANEFDKMSDRNERTAKRYEKISKGKSPFKEELNLEDYSLEDLEDFMMSEDFEQLDELSKKTLGSYVKKASRDAVAQGVTYGLNVGDGNREASDKVFKKGTRRLDNVNRAINKLTKEQVEEIEALAAKHGLGE